MESVWEDVDGSGLWFRAQMGADYGEADTVYMGDMKHSVWRLLIGLGKRVSERGQELG